MAEHPQWTGTRDVLGEGHVGRALMNSLIVASATMLICVVVGAMAAYALARFDVPLKRNLLMLVLMHADVPAGRARSSRCS